MRPSQLKLALDLIATLSQATYLANCIGLPRFDTQSEHYVYGEAHQALVIACQQTLKECEYIHWETLAYDWIHNIIEATSGDADRREVRRLCPVELPTTSI